MTETLRDRFLPLLERYVRGLHIRGDKATGRAPCHNDRSPSFTADLTKCVWFCHACGRGGCVRDFAALVGEPWSSTRRESRAAKARRARFQAEQQARVILARRAEEWDKQLCAELREVQAEVAWLAYLLTVFRDRPDLTEEFHILLTGTEKEYGEALFRCTVLEGRLDGVVE